MLPGKRDFSKIFMNIGGPSVSLSQNWNTDFTFKLGILSPFIPNALFLYPLKTSENCEVFWYFQGVEKGSIRSKSILASSI